MFDYLKICKSIIRDLRLEYLDILVSVPKKYQGSIPHVMILSSRHWNEFYELNDLQILASVGISHIRIPYGYWMFDVESDEPFPEPSQNDEEGMRFYLKRMLTWAESVGIKVKCSIIEFKFTNSFQ